MVSVGQQDALPEQVGFGSSGFTLLRHRILLS
jgi:hypothetical protein